MTEEEYKRWKEQLKSRLSKADNQEVEQQVEKIATPKSTEEPVVAQEAAIISPEVLEAKSGDTLDNGMIVDDLPF